MVTAYDYIISLGGACAPAWQIEMFTERRLSLPFNWVVLPFRSLRAAIEHDFHHFTREEAFGPVHGGWAIQNRSYPLVHLHDFHLDKSRPDQWKDQIAEVRGKFDHLINHWRSIMSSKSRILFVRQEGHFDEIYYKLTGRISSIEADLLCDTIARRYPLISFDVLFADAVVGEPSDGRAMVRDVGYASAADWPDEQHRWRGPTGRWQEALAEIAEKPSHLVTANGMD